MELLFDCPWYCIFLCLLAGALYSAALYWRQRGSKGDDMPRGVRRALAVLRFVCVSLIALLLMAPMVKKKVNDNEKPIVVVAQDVSESVLEAKGYTAIDIDHLRHTTLKDYEVIVDSFGGKSTDIAAELAAIADRYAGRNLGAVVLATDGIYNQGQNPATSVEQLAVPIYTVALGDTTHHAGATIADVRYNHLAYLGSQFPIEVTVNANRLKGQSATLSISHDGKVLQNRPIRYTDNLFSTTESFTLDADHPGLQSYRISLGPNGPARTIAVEVIDGHQKIAILGATAHPDIGALRQSIERNPNYEVSVFLGQECNSINAKDYSLIILHNLPGGLNTKANIPTETPAIYIIGSQTDLTRFNALHSGLEIAAKARKNDEVTASANGGFALFEMDKEHCHRIEQMPPLTAPFGTYRPAANLQCLFTAKVGGVESGRPLVAFCQQQGVRHAFIVGEGIWHWRLQDFLMTGNHNDFDQLVEKMVVYTAMQDNKERFRTTAKHIYSENEEVTIEAELYNDNFEPVNTPDAHLILTHPAKPHSQADYDFYRLGSHYALNLGTLPAGQYGYTAHTTFAGKKYTASGNFIVEDIGLEQTNTVADHALLNTLSQTTGGQMLNPGQLNQLGTMLDNRGDLKTVVYSHTRYTEWLNLPLLFILLVLLLGAEWVTRKITIN